MSSSESFMGQIMISAFDYAPRNWAPCNGQILGVTQYQALFSLLGNTFGGDGKTTFGLPNLNGRVPIGAGTSMSGTQAPVTVALGSVGGEESHSLSIAEMPSHPHNIYVDATNPASSNSNTPTQDNSLGQSIGSGPNSSTFAVNIYSSSRTNPAVMASQSVGFNGSGQGHENRQPFLGVGFCICLFGTYPSRQ